MRPALPVLFAVTVVGLNVDGGDVVTEVDVVNVLGFLPEGTLVFKRGILAGSLYVAMERVVPVHP